MTQAQTSRQMSDAVVNGAKYHLIAFYFPDDHKGTPWDSFYNYTEFGNFFVCPSKITLTANGITGVFHTSEAAFQATKWWKYPQILKQFENAPNGPAALAAKKYALSLKKTCPADDDTISGYAGLGQLGSMSAILKLKYSDPTFKQLLFDTGDAYLLEHNSSTTRDHFWSDNQDGTGGNHLGKTLMDIRGDKTLVGGAGAPVAEGTYYVGDFTSQVKPAP
jgi:hypothetical protein